MGEVCGGVGGGVCRGNGGSQLVYGDVTREEAILGLFLTTGGTMGTLLCLRFMSFTSHVSSENTRLTSPSELPWKMSI